MRVIAYLALLVAGHVLYIFPQVPSSCQSHGNDAVEDLMKVMMKMKCRFNDTAETVMKPAFFSTLKPLMTNLFANTTVKFDNVLINIGNGYSPTTGKFTAPSTGVYEFSCNFLKMHNEDTFELILMKNEKRVARGNGDKTPFSSGSIRVILDVMKGDQIYVSHPRSTGALFGEDYSMFSGHMI